MKKDVVKINEGQLRKIVNEAVKKVLKEDTWDDYYEHRQPYDNDFISHILDELQWRITMAREQMKNVKWANSLHDNAKTMEFRAMQLREYLEG